MLRTITFYLDEAIHKELKSYCVDNDISMKEFITTAIKEYLRKNIQNKIDG